MAEFTHNDVVEECKLRMIAGVEREICRLVTPILEKRMAEYKQSFGRFSRTDANLWSNIDLGYELACECADFLDEYNFDIDDAVDTMDEELVKARHDWEKSCMQLLTGRNTNSVGGQSRRRMNEL